MDYSIRRINEMVQALGYTGMMALINEWVVGKNAERDREIMRYRLLDGLTIQGVTDRYAEMHPGTFVSEETVKRTIRERAIQIFAHFPG